MARGPRPGANRPATRSANYCVGRFIRETLVTFPPSAETVKISSTWRLSGSAGSSTKPIVAIELPSGAQSGHSIVCGSAAS